MDFKISETNKGKKSLVHDGYVCHIDSGARFYQHIWFKKICSFEQGKFTISSDEKFRLFHYKLAALWLNEMCPFDMAICPFFTCTGYSHSFATVYHPGNVNR